MLEQEVAMKRFGRLQEISNIALFLASEYPSFITSTIIRVDSGQLRS